MKKSILVISLLSSTFIMYPDITIASGIPTYTHTYTPELKPISFAQPDKAFKTASICFLGVGDCDPNIGFGKGNEDYNIDTAKQCKNEGFVKLNCSGLQEAYDLCPYNYAYGKVCKCKSGLVTCAAIQSGVGLSCDGKYASCTCPSGVYAGTYGCAEYYATPCSSACKTAKSDNCDRRTAVSAPYGCSSYWSDCPSKCQTAYSDNCRNRTAATCSYGCSSYYSDCPSKCQSCISCSNTCATGSTSVTCGSGYAKVTSGTTRCGNTCYSCSVTSCPSGYSTEITSCPTGYSFVTSGVSAGKTCGKCDCKLTATSCQDAYEVTQSCVKDGVTYYKCELCHRQGGSAEGLYYCYNNDGRPSYGFTPVATISKVCGNKNYRTSCGCEAAKFFNRPYIGNIGSGYVATICGARGYRGNYVNNQSLFYRGFVSDACEENGRNVGFNKCVAYQCVDSGYKVVESAYDACAVNQNVCCCPEGYSGTPNSPSCKKVVSIGYEP